MPESPPIASRPRVALVGVSGYGVIHLQELQRLHAAGAIVLAACVAVDAPNHPELLRTLAANGCEIYTDFATMLRAQAGRLDLCCLPTPISCHAPMALDALAAGANVLVEKPLTATLDEAAAIADAERRSGRFVAVGFQDIYQPANEVLKAALLAGELGRLREIRILAARARPLSYYRRNNWAGRITSHGTPVHDSPVNNAFAHFVNLALFFAGAAPARSAQVRHVQADLFRAQPIENFDTAVLHAQTDTGVAIKCYTTHSCAAELPQQLLLVGEHGTAEWTNNESVRITVQANTRHIPLPAANVTRPVMFDRVIARLSDARTPICGLECATEHVRLVELIQTTAAIRNVNPASVQRTALANGDEQIAIAGIEDDFRAAYASGKTFAEMAPAWSRA